MQAIRVLENKTRHVYIIYNFIHLEEENTMPFPLAAVVVGAVGAVGTAVATVASVALAAAPYVLAGAAVLGGIALTSEIIEENKRKEEEARRAAKRAASRENEKRKLQEKRNLDRKIQNVKEKYGSNAPKEVQEELLLESSELLGSLKGNRQGLEKQGQSASTDAIRAEDELKELQKQLGLKK